jgi:ribonucleoside-diphosphate reductase alpha chain
MFLEDGTEIELSKLKIGDILSSRNIEERTVKFVSFYGYEDVYNITIDDNHNYFIITSSNARICVKNCGEILMGGSSVCNLFSLNLVKFILKNEDGSYSFDYENFKKAVSIAVRFSDNINDISRVPLPEYKKSIIEKRRIGVGVMALGSLHYVLGIKYGSEESLKLIESIFKTKAETEILASAKLGKEKGSFKLFDKEKYFSTYWWKNLPISEEVKKEVETIGEMRNSHRSANAPTGNNSIYAGIVSGGIEPVFDKEYIRWTTLSENERAKLRDAGFKFPDVHVGEWFETKHLKFEKRGTDEILIGTFEDVNYQVDKNRGLTKGMLVEDYGWRFVKKNFSPEKIKELEDKGVFVTANELSITEHINPLKIIAKYTDLNSSKTINIPSGYPYEDFKSVYMDAWKSGIKGITTYRAGTTAAVLEKREDAKEQQDDLEATFKKANGNMILEKMKLPEQAYSNLYTIKDSNRKNWYVNISFADLP